MTAKTFVPLHFVATPRAAKALGDHAAGVAKMAFIEIGRATGNYTIHYAQFRTPHGDLIAVASRVKASGIVEIEIDLGNAKLPWHVITAAQHRAAIERCCRRRDR